MALSSPAKSSPFMLLFRDAGPQTHLQLSSDKRADLARQWNEWVDGLVAQGKMQHGHPLGLEGRVVSGAGGRTVVDGPYAEAKEAIGGYLYLSVADLDEATAIAKQCPSLSLGLIVEVRPVVEFSPVLEGVRARS